MSILATKLFIPSPGPAVVRRPRLIQRLDDGAHSKLTLISAPAGFGKTTLAAEWVAGCGKPAAWVSFDEGDGNSTRFLQYVAAALQTVDARMGKGLSAMLGAPQPPSTEAALTTLLNEIAAAPQDIVLVLDDYHVVDDAEVDRALALLVERLPSQVRLVVATREDPNIPLARLRARGQLTEIRAADLRFGSTEAEEFLVRGMGLELPAGSVAALESRTEGWIAGLQLAALSLQGRADAAGFIASFTGSHRFILDYLIEEVLRRQTGAVQSFLLRTSLLGRLCGPLCDAVTRDASAPGMETLERLERANLFVVPLDDERRWYRYHRLFADALQQRLRQGLVASGKAPDTVVAELHVRASAWYEEKGLEIEAFHHAAEANDVERAERLIEGGGMPLHFRGALAPVLGWLKSLPAEVLDSRPSLWTAFASVVLATGHVNETEDKLRSAESVLADASPDEKVRDLIGRIAAIRATLAVHRLDADAIIAQSRRALEFLAPSNHAFRTSTNWKMGVAYGLQGDRIAAGRAYGEVIAACRGSGNAIFALAAALGLAGVQESQTELRLAAETYRRVLDSAGDMPLPIAACQANLGLARICCEWNDLDGAHQHWARSVPPARQLADTDRFVACQLFEARMRICRGRIDEADAILAAAEREARQHNFTKRASEVAAARVLVLIRQGNLAAAERLARAHPLPLSRARVKLARGETKAALAVLASFRQDVEAKGWRDEQLRTAVLQALARRANGERDEALRCLREALALAAPNGLVRTFVDEGAPMASLLAEAAALGVMPDYVAALRDAFRAEEPPVGVEASPGAAESLIEALTRRELEVLRLVAEGLSNEEIGERLFLSLSTVKGHNQKIFDKLQVRRRTEAVVRARELRLL